MINQNLTSELSCLCKAARVSVFLFLLGTLFLFPGESVAQSSTVLVGSGSTVPLPLYRRWSEEFNKRRSDVQMRYLPLGTNEGVRQASHGSSDFGAGEVPLTPSQRREGGLIELPVMLVGIVPVYNLPQVHRELRFSGELLADIFLGRVKVWNSPEITRLNPGVALPDLSIRVIYRPEGKGTNYVFTDYLSKTSAKFKALIGTSASPGWPVGTAAERSSDMTDAVKRIPGSIGYVELQYAQRDNLQLGLVLNLFGRFVKASPDTIAAACEAIESPGWDKFSASLTNAPGNASFPITSFTWVYVPTRRSDPHRSAALFQLLNWMFTEGQPLGQQLGYSELPKPLLEKARTKLKSFALIPSSFNERGIEKNGVAAWAVRMSANIDMYALLAEI